LWHAHHKTAQVAQQVSVSGAIVACMACILTPRPWLQEPTTLGGKHPAASMRALNARWVDVSNSMRIKTVVSRVMLYLNVQVAALCDTLNVGRGLCGCMIGLHGIAVVPIGCALKPQIYFESFSGVQVYTRASGHARIDGHLIPTADIE
jgi:hypothetical protein